MNKQSAEADPKESLVIDDLLSNGLKAMEEIASATQEQIDEMVTAIAWALYKPENARAMATLAVEDTGIGNVEDKVIKNTRKTFGTLRDLLRVKTVGKIDEHNGMARYAKPVGVVAAITPSTNPAATPVNKSMMALKGGNAIVVAPSPAGWVTTSATVKLMRDALAKIGAPKNLVQILPAPVTRSMTTLLMQRADLIVATGSQNNVRNAYSSGTPALGVGAGNVAVIIDSTADLNDAAAKIVASKTFDNSTSCSSENSLIILDDVYDASIDALIGAGAYRCSSDEIKTIETELWQDGKLNRKLIASDADVFAGRLGFSDQAQSSKLFLAEQSEFDASSPFADEKLSLVLTVYRARDFDHAEQLIDDIMKAAALTMHLTSH